MQAWLRHWRWWLLLGCCLVVLGLFGALLYKLLTPDPVGLAFSRVQLGMTESDVRAVVNEIGEHKREQATGDLVVDEQFPVIDPAIPERTIPRFAQDTWTNYRVGTGQITVVYRDERAIHKISFRSQTAWDRLRPFLKRMRSAVGL